MNTEGSFKVFVILTILSLSLCESVRNMSLRISFGRYQWHTYLKDHFHSFNYEIGNQQWTGRNHRRCLTYLSIVPSSCGIILSSSTNSSFMPNITKATSGGLDSSDVHVIYPQSLPTVTVKDDGKFALLCLSTKNQNSFCFLQFRMICHESIMWSTFGKRKFIDACGSFSSLIRPPWCCWNFNNNNYKWWG